MSPSHSLPPESFTARRLEHATPEHLHQTTRRIFIGPIPEGWLKSHRKQWYRQYVGRGGKRAPSFTAAHSIAHPEDTAPRQNTAHEDAPRPSSQSVDTTHLRSPAPTSTTSQTSLLHGQHAHPVDAPPSRSLHDGVQEEVEAEAAPSTESVNSPRLERTTVKRAASHLKKPKVRFSEASRLQLRARASRLAAKGTFRSSKIREGEMMKVDKMLVRIDITQQSVREDYDEKASQGVETKSMDKWREFMVVCRKHTDGDSNYVLQLYQTRVIAASEGDKVKKKPKVQIALGPRSRANLYSALDKTLCVWTTNGMRTTIYFLRAQSTAAAVDWYTFLGGLLGHSRAQTLQVNVPDLSLTLRLDDPFRRVEAAETLAKAAEGDDEALVKAINEEKGAAGAIVSRCVEMLKQSPEWADVLKSWAQYDRIGLAWKRYDRLEWIFGEVEQRMYGTIAMARTHDLELRPKDHYPVVTPCRDGGTLEEPAPVEGFLIRLTSQKGQEKRLGKMMFKRLYFATQDQYLLFVRPAKATPPPPPRMPVHENDANVPSTKEISDRVPLSYDVNPYPLENDRIAWLDTEGVRPIKDQENLDQEAANEAARNVNMLIACDGFIDLCSVKQVRRFQKGAVPADENLEDGDDVDFHSEGTDSRQDNGTTAEVDEDRILELVLFNGLVIRLQAYNKSARNEWMKRLRELVAYWTLRSKADMDLYKLTRDQNLRQLGIDERAEAVVGQFAYKWEVSQSYASPLLYNMCGISECRPIHLSGSLFRKPRKHTTFTRCHVILSHGHLLIFQDQLRRRTGKKLVHIHHERIASIALQGCYLYSGLLTENDLLYQNQTFDSNAPGHHALPRIYLEDNWTSTDEDAMTTFVIWHAKSRSWFKSSQNVDDVKAQERNDDASSRTARTKTKLTRVSQLGATGRSVVFKARSRAERDHWVLAIQVEIERLAAQNDEVRIVDASKK